MSERTLEELRCSECGEFLENTGGEYSLCPNGHGKLHGKLDEDDLQRISTRKVPRTGTPK